ncbi:membrane or secreted protein, partial [gut metagenome]
MKNLRKGCRANLPAGIFSFALLLCWQLGAMKMSKAFIPPLPHPDPAKAVGAAGTAADGASARHH